MSIFLAEEFAVNLDLRRFKDLTRFSNISAVVVDCWISRADELGESDLVIVYQTMAQRDLHC